MSLNTLYKVSDTQLIYPLMRVIFIFFEIKYIYMNYMFKDKN